MAENKLVAQKEAQSFNKGLIGIIVLLVIAFIVTMTTIYIMGQPRSKDVFLIPQGFHGEISVHYGIDGAPELQKENGYYVNKLDSKGELSTSTKGETSFPRGEDKFYYVDDKGNKTELLRDQQDFGVFGGDMMEKKSMLTGHFFVGTKAEFDKYSIEEKKKEDAEKKLIKQGM